MILLWLHILKECHCEIYFIILDFIILDIRKKTTLLFRKLISNSISKINIRAYKI